MVVLLLSALGGLALAQEDPWPAQAQTELASQVSADFAGLSDCRQHLRTPRPPQLRLIVRVNADGSVASAWATAVQRGDDRMARCVERRARAWRFSTHTDPRPRRVSQTLELPMLARSIDRLPGRPDGVPRVRMGPPTVGPAYSPEVVRRIVFRHRREVQFCYEQQWMRTPGLAGRIDVAFTILETGAVAEVSIAASTVPNETVGACIAQAFRRWQFPAPRAGRLNVRYPLFFQPPG